MPDKHLHAANKNLKTAFFLNLSFSLIEIVGGILTNSTAILADAVHDMGDTIALGQAWYFENLAKQKGTKKYSYGYKRFSLFGAMISITLLLISSLFILSEAIPRLMEPEHSNAQGMVFLAIIGILVNGYAMLKLDRHDQHASANVKIVALHLLEDVLGWVAVLIVAIVLLFQDIRILDPLLAILITLYILYGVFKNIQQTLPVFLQATPESINLDALKAELESIQYVNSVHHIHVWSLDGQHNVLTAHLMIKDNLEKENILSIKNNAKSLIDKLDFYHSTLELEYPEETCRMETNHDCL